MNIPKKNAPIAPEPVIQFPNVVNTLSNPGYINPNIAPSITATNPETIGTKRRPPKNPKNSGTFIL